MKVYYIGISTLGIKANLLTITEHVITGIQCIYCIKIIQAEFLECTASKWSVCFDIVKYCAKLWKTIINVFQLWVWQCHAIAKSHNPLFIELEKIHVGSSFMNHLETSLISVFKERFFSFISWWNRPQKLKPTLRGLWVLTSLQWTKDNASLFLPWINNN